GTPVLSVDLPSGVDADTGAAHDPHVRAARTVTFGAWKRGLVLYPGAAAAGTVELVDIGIPDVLLHNLEGVPLLVEKRDVARRLPPREPAAHKGDAGRVLVVGGSRGLGGAALLAGIAALRGGAGLVTLGLPASLAAAVEASAPEVMGHGLPEGDAGALAADAAEPAGQLAAAADAVAVGPGLGTGDGAAEVVRAVVAAAAGPVVADADALNLAARTPGLLEGGSAPLVITPHPGEAARLLGIDTAAVQSDRLAAARELARRYRATAVLKGARTVVAAVDGPLVVNPTGTPAMAGAGMGDALTGLIAALAGQGLSGFDAAVGGVWLHGRAGELAAAGADAGILASDLIAQLPAARRELRE
ncbi:MAG: NAD(P)H-hydrate dehydratase, partial [Armatimonadetes bacterium]|nr:NAD(P)H-hydrate dehydratase [Armatimonadota bacterium]